VTLAGNTGLGGAGVLELFFGRPVFLGAVDSLEFDSLKAEATVVCFNRLVKESLYVGPIVRPAVQNSTQIKEFILPKSFVVQNQILAGMSLWAL
jgi:hypothetical protein